MRFNPFKDVTYHHHWKLMTLTAAAVFLGLIFAFMKSWFLVAAVLAVFFLMLLIQWITIDPPDVTEQDVHGKR
jgi:hypothetical protein